MKTPAQTLTTRALSGALLLLLTAACSEHKEQVASVQELLDDRVRLDGILMKCEQHPGLAECSNARTASARLSVAHDAQQASKRDEDFERRREQLRLQQERERQSQDVQKPDPYHLPVVPVDPPPGDAPHS